MENEQIEDAFLNTGPPEASHDGDAQQPQPLFFAGFVPNLQDRLTEEDHLHQAALQGDDLVILTMPSMHGTPISEHAGHHIAIDAFPTLFLTGKVDIAAECDEAVEMKDWASHLMKLKGGHLPDTLDFNIELSIPWCIKLLGKYQIGIYILMRRINI